MNHYHFFLTFIIMTVLCSCNNCLKKERHIIIEEWTYKIDLDKKQYIVYRSPDSVVIHFPLSKMELFNINKRYCELGIDKLQESVIIEDACMWNPKVYTTIYINDDKNRVYKIDMDCRRGYSDEINSGKIYLFTKYVLELIKNKKEVKNAPKSDMLIM